MVLVWWIEVDLLRSLVSLISLLIFFVWVRIGFCLWVGVGVGVDGLLFFFCLLCVVGVLYVVVVDELVIFGVEYVCVLIFFWLRLVVVVLGLDVFCCNFLFLLICWIFVVVLIFFLLVSRLVIIICMEFLCWMRYSCSFGLIFFNNILLWLSVWNVLMMWMYVCKIFSVLYLGCNNFCFSVFEKFVVSNCFWVVVVIVVFKFFSVFLVFG